ncbi:MAG: Gfo/Idh/MocA family oxidoreductase [Anaerolineae bacterium]|nr:Gfo/Idh/MocA family oxidoreductase [Anaerolineae bacterium]
MTANGSVRIAVVGCGYWGVNYVRSIADMPETTLAALCDVDANRLNEMARRYPSARMAEDIDDLLARDDFDAAVVSTSAASHYRIASALLEYGKHVLIEKPMTTDVGDAARLVEMADAAALKLMVGHIFLFNTGIETIKRYLVSGDLGQPYYLYARRTNLGPIRDDVNALWDLATHDVSIFNYLLDRAPDWVSAVGSTVLHTDRQDVGFIVLGYPDGILGHIHVSWADPHKVRELVVVGSKERIAFDDLDATEKVRVFEKGITAVADEPASFGEYHLSIRDGDIISPHVSISEPLKKQIKHFADCVLNDRRPLSDGLNGLEVVRVMAAVDESVARHGAPVVLEAMIPQREETWTPMFHS